MYVCIFISTLAKPSFERFLRLMNYYNKQQAWYAY